MHGKAWPPFWKSASRTGNVERACESARRNFTIQRGKHRCRRWLLAFNFDDAVPFDGGRTVVLGDINGEQIFRLVAGGNLMQ